MMAGIAVLILVALRWLVRIAWVANGTWLVLATFSFSVMWEVVSAAIFAITALVLLTRVGFLSLVTLVFGVMLVKRMPLTLQPGDWYFSSSLVVLAVFAFLGIWAYRSTTLAPSR
jgi:hypothetical protein